MSQEPRKKKKRLIPSLPSLPPEAQEFGLDWDDDTAPLMNLDEPAPNNAYERVTKIPELSPEEYAKQVMEEVNSPSTSPLPKTQLRQMTISTSEPPPSERQTLPESDPNHLEADAASPFAELRDRYAMGDFSGALLLAEAMLETNPDDAQALRYAQSCRDVLTQMYSARLGSLDQLVSVAVAAEEIRWLSLDHHAGFLLSMIDGSSTIEEILDVSGMPKLDALRILYTLVEQRVIALGGLR